MLGGSFLGGDGADTVLSAIQVGGRFVGGPGKDGADTVYGTFLGNKGWDSASVLYGRFNGGPGMDRLGTCASGDARAPSVELGDVPCPPPKSLEP